MRAKLLRCYTRISTAGRLSPIRPMSRCMVFALTSPSATSKDERRLDSSRSGADIVGRGLETGALGVFVVVQDDRRRRREVQYQQSVGPFSIESVPSTVFSRNGPPLYPFRPRAGNRRGNSSVLMKAKLCRWCRVGVLGRLDEHLPTCLQRVLPLYLPRPEQTLSPLCHRQHPLRTVLQQLRERHRLSPPCRQRRYQSHRLIPRPRKIAATLEARSKDIWRCAHESVIRMFVFISLWVETWVRNKNCLVTVFPPD
jgi:hypothetical protein